MFCLAACGRGGSSGYGGPPRLEPLPETGALPIEMNGAWGVDEVVVLQEAGTATEPLREPAGFMPPLLGSELRIAGDQAVAVDSRDLARGATGHAQVPTWVNVADGQRLVYYRYATTPSQPGRADSGGAEHLQFVFGSIDPDTMQGLVQYSFASAFPPRERPVGGLSRVTLRRVAAPR